MAEGIVVEGIRGGHPPNGDDQAVSVAFSGNLIRTVLHFFHVAGKANSLPQIKAGDIRSRLRNAHAHGLAVGKAAQTESATETKAAGELRVEVDFASLPNLGAQVERAGHGGAVVLHRQ